MARPLFAKKELLKGIVGISSAEELKYHTVKRFTIIRLARKSVGEDRKLINPYNWQ